MERHNICVVHGACAFNTVCFKKYKQVIILNLPQKDWVKLLQIVSRAICFWWCFDIQLTPLTHGIYRYCILWFETSVLIKASSAFVQSNRWFIMTAMLETIKCAYIKCDMRFVKVGLKPIRRQRMAPGRCSIALLTHRSYCSFALNHWYRTIKITIFHRHYNDVIMTTMASQITSLAIVYSTVYSDTDERKHQSSASLAFLRAIHRWPVNSLHKGPVTRNIFPFDDVTVGNSKHSMCPLWTGVRRPICETMCAWHLT